VDHHTFTLHVDPTGTMQVPLSVYRLYIDFPFSLESLHVKEMEVDWITYHHALQA